MRVSEALLKGKAFLQEHKWGRGWSYNKADNSFCALGALYGGVYGMGFWEGPVGNGLDWDAVREAENLLNRAANFRGATSTVQYNDGQAHRKRDVLTLYDRAIALAQNGDSSDQT